MVRLEFGPEGADSSFHPADDSHPIFLSSKMIFLLLLALVRRHGDIHIIDPNRVTFMSLLVILEPCPGYLLKIHNTVEREACYLPIIIRSLRLVISDPVELMLCPVEVLKAYGSYTEHEDLCRSRYFISLRRDGKVVSKATTLAWVIKLLRRAYPDTTDPDARLASASIHKLRALATSLAVQATFALSDILKATTLAMPSTFVTH